MGRKNIGLTLFGPTSSWPGFQIIHSVFDQELVLAKDIFQIKHIRLLAACYCVCSSSSRRSERNLIKPVRMVGVNARKVWPRGSAGQVLREPGLLGLNNLRVQQVLERYSCTSSLSRTKGPALLGLSTMELTFIFDLPHLWPTPLTYLRRKAKSRRLSWMLQFMALSKLVWEKFFQITGFYPPSMNNFMFWVGLSPIGVRKKTVKLMRDLCLGSLT